MDLSSASLGSIFTLAGDFSRQGPDEPFLAAVKSVQRHDLGELGPSYD